MTNLQEHLNEFYKNKIAGDRKMIGIFVKGSQNYNLDTEKSDTDTILLVAPSLEDLKNNTMFSKSYKMENNDIITIQDFRKYLKSLYKPTFSNLEILFTDYYIIDINYLYLWVELLIINEQIAHLNSTNLLHSVLGIATSFYNKLSPFEDCGKSASFIYYLNTFVDKYLDNKNYFDCLKLTKEEKDLALALKQNSYDSTETYTFGYNEYVCLKQKIEHNFCEQSTNLDLEWKITEIFNRFMFQVLTDITHEF